MSLTVSGINNIKSAQKSSENILMNHWRQTVFIKPDAQRDYYWPSEEFTLTLKGPTIDYINLNNSYLYFKVRIISNNLIDSDNVPGQDKNTNFFPYVFAGGGAAFIDTLTVFNGQQEIEKIPNYNILMNLLIEHHLRDKFRNEETLFNATPLDSAYRDYLHVRDRSTDSPKGQAWSKPRWIQIPLVTTLEAGEYLPVYQLIQPIQIKIKLAQDNLVWNLNIISKNANLKLAKLVHGETQAPRAQLEGTQYVLQRDASHKGFRGGAIYNYINIVNNLKPSITNLDNHYQIKFNLVQNEAPSYVIEDVMLVADTLQVLPGGGLNNLPYEFFSESWTCFEQQSNTKLTEEYFTFDIKKSNINKALAVFIPSDLKIEKDYSYKAGRINYWLRGEYINNSEVFRAQAGLAHWYSDLPPWNFINGVSRLDTNVYWFSWKLGPIAFPSPNGVGVKNNPDIFEYDWLLYLELLKQYGHDDINGYLQNFLPSKESKEISSRYEDKDYKNINRPQTFSFNTNLSFGGQFFITPGYELNPYFMWKTNDTTPDTFFNPTRDSDVNRPFFAETILTNTFSPSRKKYLKAWFTRSRNFYVYAGQFYYRTQPGTLTNQMLRAIEYGYWGDTQNNQPEDVFESDWFCSWLEAYDVLMPAGKFVMAGNFQMVSENGVISGIDTERYPLTLTIQRKASHNPNAVGQTLYAFINYTLKISFIQGLIVVND